MALIGPNGAGKSTLMNVLSGLCHADQGEIQFDGEPIHRLDPPRISLSGVGRTFQIPCIFRLITVGDNVLVPAAHAGEISGHVRGRVKLSGKRRTGCGSLRSQWGAAFQPHGESHGGVALRGGGQDPQPDSRDRANTD